jgi:hypothetical protein
MYKPLIYTFLILILIKDAHAYIDPGSGSFFFQMLLAGLLSVTVMIKPVKEKIISILKKILPATDTKDDKK